MEQKITKVLATLELHLPGRSVTLTKPGGYTPMKVRYRREVEWSGWMTFNPKLPFYNVEALTLNLCLFGPHLFKTLAPEYYLERAALHDQPKYHVGNLIPKAQQNLEGKAKSFLMEPSGVRYADYTSQPKPLYNLQEQQPKRVRLYEPSQVSVRGYLPAGQQIREETQAE